MEGVVMRGFSWHGRRVFLTGHTGFKGGWLALWLSSRGAQVHGYALKPPTQRCFFEVTGLSSRMACSTIGDIRDPAALENSLAAARPELVLHLAAQSLVRASYVEPVQTYATNVMGTVHLLEAVRKAGCVRAVVNVTTDKCYENREWPWPYRENEALGGHDPYSSSKACSEILTSAWRRSFLEALGVEVATARAGNVIGGGDWAQDRLVPDFLRAIDAGEVLRIRSPHSVRPWQHVLEPLSGYLLLSSRLLQGDRQAADAFNFGPSDADARPVSWIADALCRQIPGARVEVTAGASVHEAGLLRLDSSRARTQLGWESRWNLQKALSRTVQWHQAWRAGKDMAAFSLAQVADYEAAGSAA
jgi:CDP-glucose 4,6-dehydratase